MPESLEALRLPHQNEVIKVFSSPEDPRTELGRSALSVVEVDGGAFAEAEVYEYEQRRAYSGQELEEDLAAYDLSTVGTDMVRSLLRFSHGQGFCQAAMAAHRRNVWVIRHPFESIDGIASAKQSENERTLHLDIFLPTSLKKLLKVVDYRDTSAVLPWQDGAEWFRTA